MPALDVTIRHIEPGDQFSGLSLGHADFVPLKTFLKKFAAHFHDNRLARTYGVFLSGTPKKAVGYMTLACGEIETSPHLRQEEPDFPYPHYPAIKLARLAVNLDLRGQGIGRRLTRMAIGIAKDEICPLVGCRFVTLDAKKQSIDFYKKEGFTLLDTTENAKRDHPVMFLDLNKH